MYIHHSNSLETLAAGFAARLREEPADPVVPERVVVSHPTMRRWLNLELAQANGIAANNRFELPAEFAWAIIRDMLPSLPRHQPFAPDNMRWRLFDVLPEFARMPGGEAVRRYLADGDPRKRFELAQELARVFDRCLLYRPHWIREWETGEAPHWQARLWRLAVERVGRHHWVNALDSFHESLAQGGAPASWPRRVTFFAVSALSPSYLELIRSVAGAMELHFHVLNPCRQYWGDIFTRFETVVRSGGDSPEALHITEGNELLAACGRIRRDIVDILLEMEGVEDIERFVPPAAGRRLDEVKGDILDLRLARDAGPAPGARADDSLQVHACHSAMREAEVLHDRLLDLLERHGDIEAADIQILTPDPERYGPAIVAVFDSTGRLPVTLSRVRSEESPSARAFFGLLDLVRSRFGAEEVMAPLEAETLRTRFGIGEEFLVLIRRWIAAAAIRWGVDRGHREEAGRSGEAGNTWHEGLRRLLMGYATGDVGGLVHGIAPVAVTGLARAPAGETEHATLGRFMSYCDAAFGLRRSFDGARPAGAWVDALHAMIDRFFVPAAGWFSVDMADEVEALRRLVADFEDQATQGRAPLPFEVVCDVLKHLAEKRSRRPSVLNDSIAVSELAAGQVLPARVICLVGMNDESFPRSPAPSTFDLVAAGSRQRGDRDVRQEDRLAFLEALVSAATSLVVTYTGRGIRDDVAIPPSVVVDELLEYLRERFPDAAFRTEHPLQPFDARYFREGSGLFSYSAPMCDTARTLLDSSRGAGDANRFMVRIDDRAAEPVAVGLAELERFFADPARAFLRERLDVLLVEDDPALDEEDPFDPDGLELFRLRDTMVRMFLDGGAPGDIEETMLHCGRFPPGPPGLALVRHEAAAAARLAATLETYGVREAGQVEFDLVAGGIRVAGTVGNVTPDALLHWHAGRIGASQRIAVHLRQLALMACGHGAVQARLFGREGDGWEERVMAPPGAGRLEDWLQAFAEGRRAPLPFAPRTSLAFSDAVTGPSSSGMAGALAKARAAWSGHPGAPGEGEKPALALVWDDRDPMDHGFAETAGALPVPPPRPGP